MNTIEAKLVIKLPEEETYRKKIVLEEKYLKILYKHDILKKKLTQFEEADYADALSHIAALVFGGTPEERRAHLFRPGSRYSVDYAIDDVKTAYEALAEGKK